jgi:hypothetical protein
MKAYTFFIPSQSLTLTVKAINKTAAIQTIAYQLNIKTARLSEAIVCLGINLQGVAS